MYDKLNELVAQRDALNVDIANEKKSIVENCGLSVGDKCFYDSELDPVRKGVYFILSLGFGYSNELHAQLTKPKKDGTMPNKSINGVYSCSIDEIKKID